MGCANWEQDPELLNNNLLKLYELSADNPSLREAIFETIDGVIEMTIISRTDLAKTYANGKVPNPQCEFDHAMKIYDLFVASPTFKADDAAKIIHTARLHYTFLSYVGLLHPEVYEQLPSESNKSPRAPQD